MLCYRGQICLWCQITARYRITHHLKTQLTQIAHHRNLFWKWPVYLIKWKIQNFYTWKDKSSFEKRANIIMALANIKSFHVPKFSIKWRSSGRMPVISFVPRFNISTFANKVIRLKNDSETLYKPYYKHIEL